MSDQIINHAEKVRYSLTDIWINWDNVVKIRDVYGENYYMPLENTDVFILEVDERIAHAKNK